MPNLSYDTQTEAKKETICGLPKIAIFVFIGIVVVAAIAVAIACGVVFGLRSRHSGSSGGGNAKSTLSTIPESPSSSPFSAFSGSTPTAPTTASTSTVTTIAPDICRKYTMSADDLGEVDFIGYPLNRTQVCQATWDFSVSTVSYFAFKMESMNLHGAILCPTGSDIIHLLVCKTGGSCTDAFPGGFVKYCRIQDFQQDSKIHPLLLNETEYFEITLDSSPQSPYEAGKANGSFDLKYSEGECGGKVTAGGTSVNITSPLYGFQVFPNNAVCTWTISPDTGVTEVELTFYHFSLNTENSYDFGKIDISRCYSNNTCESGNTLYEKPKNITMVEDMHGYGYLRIAFQTNGNKVIALKDPGFIVGVEGA